MVKQNISPKGMDETLSEEQYNLADAQKFYTEQDIIQREIVARVPGWVMVIAKIQWKNLLKIIGIGTLIILIWWLVGWQTVANGFLLFCIVVPLVYMIVQKFVPTKETYFLEVKQAGQYIEPGDHNLYDKAFYTTESRIAFWSVPTILIENGYFRMPKAGQGSNMPGMGGIIIVDLFDRVNRTVVLPRDMDVANFALVANMNPMLAAQMKEVGEKAQKLRELEDFIHLSRAQGTITASEAKGLLLTAKEQQRGLMMPGGATKRDIFFDLQRVIPDLRQRLQDISMRIYMLADFLAAQQIYQIISRPMPDDIKKDHGMVMKLMGIPDYHLLKK